MNGAISPTVGSQLLCVLINDTPNVGDLQASENLTFIPKLLLKLVFMCIFYKSDLLFVIQYRGN